MLAQVWLEGIASAQPQEIVSSTNSRLSQALTGADLYLNSPIGQVHDDRLGSSDPPLDLRDGHVGTAGSHRSSPSSNLHRLPALPALGEVLVHVLSEVAEQGELLVQGRGHLAAVHRGQVVALAKLDKPRKRERDSGVYSGRGVTITTFYLRSS